MAGPNSAPNGDRRIVRGDRFEEFVEEKFYDENSGIRYTRMIPLREYLSKRGRLRTGKTDLKK